MAQVLAIASHVTFGYVGNKMVTSVLQALGMEVSAINTVYFSNHTGYKHFKGRKVPAEEISEIWSGLQTNQLDSFDMMLTGYTGSKEAVECVGKIGRDLQLRASTRPGSFFWLLDPVMGDEGRLYVAEEIVPAYRGLLHEADMIIPNAFEAEVLSETKIEDLDSLIQAIHILHQKYRVPHVIISSVRIKSKAHRDAEEGKNLMVVGSSCRTDQSPRIFSLTAPALPVFFSGTGDMFAALTLCRLREASQKAGLLGVKSWQPPDDVPSTQLPLAKAVEKTLASMHSVLTRTMRLREEELSGGESVPVKQDEDGEMQRVKHVQETKASEVRVLQGVDDIRYPVLEQKHGESVVRFEAKAIDQAP